MTQGVRLLNFLLAPRHHANASARFSMSGLLQAQMSPCALLFPVTTRWTATMWLAEQGLRALLWMRESFTLARRSTNRHGKLRRTHDSVTTVSVSVGAGPKLN